MSTSSSAVLPAGAQVFHLFSFLPTELRLQIWRDALPEADPPALAPYKANCWRPVPVAESEREESFHQSCVEMVFRPELLDHIRVKTPLTSVNHEARGAAIEWAFKQGIEVRFHEARQCLIFLRPFDPMHDVLWFSQEILEIFVQECWGVFPLINPLDNRQRVSLPIEVARFALPEGALVDDQRMNLIYDSAHCFSGNSIMYIIAGELPNFNVIDGDRTKVHPRWELDHMPNAKALVWNQHTNKFDFRSGPQILLEFAYHRILEASYMIAALSEPPLKDRDAGFEIQPVFAVRL
ncbi:hypothetical protein N7491_002037 [Penicillium cf. griseofulvum]|uniref:2EXR domain-containing protein n=1 Tax=Penicillium cf. griseofulvum TaxID=2972120 RepID=A0A9W9MTZ1_9EURO|nr:hypothetical protein N7472_003778 [Penicillium cf. griseofulvum]KAJ5445955.1 hypothetical protein N7491_002037 [Penicillium cf. griseofulvum]KAJ5447678.1 hypothetical protein N7445_002499 [Penicillium cf. griseofulvum]